MNGPHHPWVDAEEQAERVSAWLGILPIAVLLLLGAPISFVEPAQRYSLWGLIPVHWVLRVGAVVGAAMLVAIVREVGPAELGGRLRRALVGARRLWIALLGLAAIVGGIALWETHQAPQVIVVHGLPDRSVHVAVEGIEPLEWTIEPGHTFELAVKHGVHHIALSAGERRSEHDVVHEGWRDGPIHLAAP